MFADGKIEFHGQVVFAVVADDARCSAARGAARRMSRSRASRRSSPSIRRLQADSHILPDYTFVKDDAAAALAASPHRLSGTLRIGGQEHFYLEGQVGFAVPGEDRHADLFLDPASDRSAASGRAHAGLPVAAVTVEVRRMGGAFGGKETQAAQWAAIAALAARKTGRPCKLRLDRDDDMILTGKRHDFRVDYDVGFDDDGRIAGIDFVHGLALRLFRRSVAARSTTAPCSMPTMLFPAGDASIVSHG